MAVNFAVLALDSLSEESPHLEVGGAGRRGRGGESQVQCVCLFACTHAHLCVYACMCVLVCV